MTARLAAIRKTRFARRYTRVGQTRRECWAAQTTDGVWDFHREDSPGTPWLVYHLPSVADGSYTTPVTICRSLPACRQFAASPNALALVDARKKEAVLT